MEGDGTGRQLGYPGIRKRVGRCFPKFRSHSILQFDLFRGKEGHLARGGGESKCRPDAGKGNGGDENRNRLYTTYLFGGKQFEIWREKKSPKQSRLGTESPVVVFGPLLKGRNVRTIPVVLPRAWCVCIE